MTKKRKSSGIPAFVVFVVLIVIGGLVLRVTHYIDSPFDDIAFTSRWANGAQTLPIADVSAQSLTGPSLDSNVSAVDTTAASSTTKPTFQLPSTTTLTSSAANGTKPTFRLPSTSTLTDSAVSGPATTFQLPSTSTLTETATTATVDLGGEVDSQNAIDWTELGGVAYDLWFICATTAVFIIAQVAFKFSFKHIKSHLPTAAAQ